MAKSSILNLNNIPVEIGWAPRDISGAHKWNNPVQGNIARKPTKQRSGADLDTMNFTVRLRNEFLKLHSIAENPYQCYQKIKKLGDDGEIVVVSSGNGVIYGRFTLQSLSYSVLDTADDGGWVDIELSLEFEEYAS